MAEILFKTEKTQSTGFQYKDGMYTYHADLADNQMVLAVTIDAGETICTKVTDRISGDEYTLHLISGASGAFVGQIRTDYETVLEEISKNCFDFEVFKTPFAKAAIAYCKNTYGDELEYLWKKFPDNAVVRRKDNRKWYAAFLTVSRKKLGFPSDEAVEILDLRMTPEEIEKTVDGVRLLPGYHMNKKHWITICLDGTMDLEEIFRRIDESYHLAAK